MKHYDLIVGPRFGMTRKEFEDNEQGIPGLRGGSRGSYVIERLPIAGPIVRIENPGVPTKWHALCLCCRKYCAPYRRKNEPAMFKWAYDHSCPEATVEFVGRGIQR